MAKSNAHNHLFRAVIALAYKLPHGTNFKYHDLVERINHQCNTDEQREVGRCFASLVKNTNVPFVIINRKSPITYKRIKGGQ